MSSRKRKKPPPSAAASAQRRWPTRTRILKAVAAAGVSGLILWSVMHDWNAPSWVHSLPRDLSPDQLNLLIVTLDTTRADRIGTYGYRADTTPHLDRLASEGVVFENAMAVVPLTLPAHCTIFTGQPPPAHGVRDNGGFFLDDKALTLAEVLEAQGYATGAFVAAYVLDSKWGLDQGFGEYYDEFKLGENRVRSLGDIARPANEVIDQALPWLEEQANSKFFAWIHFYDPHSPYDPPEPFKTRFARRPYAGEVAFADSQLGRVLEWLNTKGLANRTVVIVMGDHGESLGEHGEATHAFFIYEGALRIPLVIKTPYTEMAGRRIRRLARQKDIFPTVLDLLGIQVPDGLNGSSFGTSLAGLMAGAGEEDGNREGYAESFYPRYHFGWSELRALRVGSLKYIEAPRPELYDLSQDPLELDNLAAARLSLLTEMGDRLADIEESMERPDADSAVHQEIDADTRARLASLGYIGTFAEPKNDLEDLADPKERIHLFNKLSDARERLSADPPDTEAAIALLHQIIEEDPMVIDAWTTLGRAHLRQKQPERAVEDFRQALKLKPDYDVAVIELANAYFALGRSEEALAAYMAYLGTNPKDAGVHFLVGQLNLDLENLDQAAAAFERALEFGPELATAQVGLGVIAYERGDLEEAQQAFEAALGTDKDVALAHHNLAKIWEDRGVFQRALAEYRREIELHPASHLTHFQLGQLLDNLGQRDDATFHYREAVDASPDFGEGYLLLAKAALDSGDVQQTISLAKKGLSLSPRSDFSALGHFLLADAYSRLGRPEEAAREATLGRELEAMLQSH